MATPIKWDTRTIDDDPTGNSSDAAIVARIQAGDTAAFESMFRLYWTQLYRYAYRYLRSADDAEEAVQTVFARIWRNRADWDVRGPLAAYLYLATRNASRDRLKHVAIERRQDVIAALAPEPAARDDADSALLTEEIEASIERSLAELPAKRRIICELRFRQNLSYAEIAQQLNVSRKTVETQIARGAKALRDRLRHFLD